MYRVKILVTREGEGLLSALSVPHIVHAAELTDAEEHRALSRAYGHLAEFMSDAQARVSSAHAEAEREATNDPPSVAADTAGPDAGTDGPQDRQNPSERAAAVTEFATPSPALQDLLATEPCQCGHSLERHNRHGDGCQQCGCAHYTLPTWPCCGHPADDHGKGGCLANVQTAPHGLCPCLEPGKANPSDALNRDDEVTE